MKILQIANDYGAPLYENLFTALRNLGIENTVYVPLNQKASIPHSGRTDVIFSRCFTDLDRLLFFSKQKKLVSDVERRDLLRDVSVIHAHTVFSGGYTACQLHKRHSLPYIVAVRNTDVNIFFKRMPHLRRTGLEVLKGAERIIFLSPAYRKYLFSRYVPDALRPQLEEKSLVIPNGIDSVFFQDMPMRKSPPGDTVRLIYVGEINSNKNLETTVQAAALLRQRGSDIRLLTVGPVTMEKYRALVEKTNFLEYHGHCSHSEVIQYLRGADIFVMPSHEETFGLVYAEAMSQGLPVLYTRGQGFDEQFPDGTVGYAISDTDPVELADRIQKVLTNYASLSENCLRLIKKFDWNKIAEQYRELYYECAGRKKA